MDNMLADLHMRGAIFPNITKEDIDISAASNSLDAIVDELQNGRGFALLRGLPLDRYNDDQINTIYYAIGLYMGQPVSQNPKGDLLGQVMNVGDSSKKIPAFMKPICTCHIIVIHLMSLLCYVYAKPN